MLIPKRESPRDYVLRLAREKALAALDKEIARLNGPHKDYPKE